MQSVAVIDLAMLKSNAMAIKSAMPPFVKFIAVVKANAYGHGAPEVANALYTVADSFAVALLKEAIELRHAGIDKDILILIPASESIIDKGLKYEVTFTVENLDIAKAIDKKAKEFGVLAKVELAVNTGMNRFGFSPKELKSVLPEIKRLKNLSVSGVFSHLYQPESPLARIKQVRIFKDAERLVKEYFPFAIAHISASGGFLKGEFFDAVRIGLMAYGYYPFKCRIYRAQVSPVMKVYAPVVKNFTLDKGENLLYGDFKTEDKVDVSIIRYGYADGLPRKSINGQLNNRCMDVSAVKSCTKNEKFSILLQNADDFAKKYDTISYEVLTSVANRSKRIYLR